MTYRRLGSPGATYMCILASSFLSFGCHTPRSPEEAESSALGSRLELAEILVGPIPASDHVIGGTFLTADKIAYWTPSTVRVLTERLRFSSTLCDGLLIAPRAVAMSVAGDVEILDKSGVVRVLAAGRCSRTTSTGTRRTISSGAMTPGGWAWIEHDSAGVPSVGLERAQVPRSLFEVLPIAREPGSQPSAVVLSSKAGFAVALTDAPYAWAAFSNGSVIATGRPPASSLDTTRSDLAGRGAFRPRWVSTGWADLGSAFLQVVADLRSDRRLLFLFNSEGSLMRETVLDFPFGVLDTDIERRLLLAVRRPDGVELAVYSWSWRAP